MRHWVETSGTTVASDDLGCKYRRQGLSQTTSHCGTACICAQFYEAIHVRSPENQISVSWDFDDWDAQQIGRSVIDMDIAIVTVFVNLHSQAGQFAPLVFVFSLY